MKDRKDHTQQTEKPNNSRVVYSNFVEIPSGRKVCFARVHDRKVYLEYVSDMVELANQSLPKEYDIIKDDYFTNESVTTSDGTIYDLANQWCGQTFLILDPVDNLVGFTLGNTSEDKGTKVGFSRLTIMNEKYHKQGLGSVLVGLLSKAFINSGVQILKGSTEINNLKMRSLIENVASHQSVDGNFLRYEIDINTMSNVSDLLTSKIGYISELFDTFGLD